MTSRIVPRLGLLLALALPACAAVENQPDPGAIPVLNEASFRCSVEPILARDCSYLACHGLDKAPFRVYAVGKLRAGAHASLADRQVAITAAERHSNFQSAAAFSYGNVKPDDNLLLRKVLPPEAGGFGHKGGAIFTGVDDARAVAIKAWLSGGQSCP